MIESQPMTQMKKMKKATYITPTIDVISIHHSTCMMSGSTLSTQGLDDEITYGGNASTHQITTADSRDDYSIWDDEDEE